MVFEKRLVYSKRLILFVFLCSVIFQSSITYTLFPTKFSFKYEVASQRYVEETLANERMIDFSPLYFYVHVAAQKYLKDPHAVLIVIQIILGGLSAVLLFMILRNFFSDPVSFLGTLAYITNRSVILYTNMTEPEPFLIFFLYAFLFFALQPRSIHVLLSGACLGLSLLTRSNFLPLAVIAPLFFWLRSKNKKHVLRMILLFEIPIIIAMSFLIYRNTAITGTLTPFSMNPGYVFFEGNNPNSIAGNSGTYPPVVFDARPGFMDKQPDYQHVIYRIVARRIQSETLSIPEVNAYWAQKAKNFIFDHPSYFFKRLLMKLRFFFHNHRRHDLTLVIKNDKALQENKIPTVPYALIAAMALVGLVVSVKQWKKYLLFYGVFCSQFGVMLLTYILERQRVVLTGVMIFFACAALAMMFRTKRGFAVVVCAVPILFAFFYLKNDVIYDELHTEERYIESDRLYEGAKHARGNGDLVMASRKNANAFALAPGVGEERRRLSLLSFMPKGFQKQALEIAEGFREDSFSARFDRALLLLNTGRLDEAEMIIKDLIQGNVDLNRHIFQSSQLYFYLARISELRDDDVQAITLLQKALANNPGDPWVLSHLAALTDNTLYTNRLFRYFDDIDAEFFLGKAYLATERFQDAAERFSFVIEKLPEHRTGQIYLSLALSKSERVEEATKYYLSALKIRQEPIFAEQDVIHMFRKWAATNPQRFDSAYYLGIILQEYGHYQEALRIQKDLLQNYPASLDASYQLHLKKRIKWFEETLSKDKEKD